MKIQNFIKDNLLFKVASANTFLVATRMIFSLISQKVLAVYIGAEGIALVGNFKNVVVFFEQFTILGTSNGLVKYISEFKEDQGQLNKLFSTGFVFTLIGVVLSFIILFFFSDILNEFIFGYDSQYGYIFKIFSFTVPFMGINAVLYSLLNGLSEYKIYTKTNLYAIALSVFLIVILTISYGLKGSLLAICIVPIIQFLSFTFFYSKGYKLKIKLKELAFKLGFKNQLLSYSLMTIVVVLSINLNEIAIRNLILNKLGLNDAGYWTAMASISKNYMQFLAAIFPLYILPIYAKIKTTYHFRREVKKIYRMLLPVVFIGMTVVYFFRSQLIKLLYTPDFLIIENLFKWQLMGDFIKFIAIVISYQFLAKKQVFYYISTEVFSVVLFYLLSVYYIDIYGIEGIVIAHFVRYVFYLIVVGLILRRSFIGKSKSI